MIYIHYPIYNSSIEEIDALISIYEDKFNALTNYIEGNKLSIYDDKLYLDQAPLLLQPLIRSYYNQDRYSLNKYLEDNFKDYFILFYYILDAYQFSYTYDLKERIIKLLQFNNNLKKKLDMVYNLYSTYYTLKSTIEDIRRKISEFEYKCALKKLKAVENNTPKTSPNLSSSISSNSPTLSSITSSMSSSLTNFNLN